MYEPLGDRQFRAVRLLPGSEINATIEVLDLSSSPLPEYLSLSYTWGRARGDDTNYSSKDHQITVNGAPFTIRENLHDALTHLHDHVRSQSLPIFVDAMSINQQDDEERSSQVILMRDIFANAHTIHAWLGVPEVEAEAQLALELLERASAIDVYDEDSDRSYFLDPRIYSQWLALADLQMQNYWNPTWILQEATGPASTFFWLGHHRFELSDLGILIELYQYSHGRRQTDPSLEAAFGPGSKWSDLAAIAIVRSDPDDRALPQFLKGFLPTCHWFRQSLCSDQRDKVYCPRGLATDIPSDIMRPDYSKSARQVFMDVACHYINGDTDLSVLHYVCHAASGPDGFVPFWTPYWHVSVKSVLATIGMWNDRVYDKPASLIPTIQGDHLVVWGKAFDRISDRTAPMDAANIEFIKGLTPKDKDPIYSHTGETQVEAFLRTIVMNGNIGDPPTLGPVDGCYEPRAKMDWTRLEHHSTESAYEDRSESDHNNWSESDHEDGGFEADGEDGSVSDDENDSTQKDYFKFIICCDGRSYCTTERGYMGLFPAAARISDVVALLVGGIVPYVLRPKGNGHYIFIGECYLHGMLDGAAREDEEDLVKIILE